MDVRVICATNRDLKEEIRRGRFREDLYFRLHVFTIQLPPLRERREDVPLLVHHFIEKFNGETGKRVQGLSPARPRDASRATPGPGNIRELRNTVERAMILVDGDVIGEEHLPARHAAVAARGGDAAGPARDPAATRSRRTTSSPRSRRTAATRRGPPRSSGSARRRSTTS